MEVNNPVGIRPAEHYVVPVELLCADNTRHVRELLPVFVPREAMQTHPQRRQIWVHVMATHNRTPDTMRDPYPTLGTGPY